ncbi:MAG: ribosome biogenesis GTPase Der [Clostridia bacterium]|nr:ribosome biogenesis GTPase Der [Clostridia bacterium]MBR5266066.1 ribosome biogenesis GTPase Der [Clostridia bacterium]
MGKPVVAIIGRPNVGKSALFNRITEKRVSIVEDRPGVTRDRIYADAEWRNIPFKVIDTGGIEPRTDDEILKFMREQALIAIDHADVIIFITDLKTGVTAADEEVGTMLKKSKKPVVLAVNKMDAPGHPPAEFYEFYNLGMGDPIGISSLHGYGTGDLLDACFEYFPEESFEKVEEEPRINVAVIGKPNAGKSSLINRISGEKRVIVSNIAGTTRDSIDTDIDNEYGKYTFVDTAGIRRKSKVEESVEKFSVMRAMMSIERADVCVIMIDAVDGVTEQDTKIAGYAHDNGKACIIAVNKWDLIEKETGTQKEYENKVRTELAYMTYAPVVFISAMTGQRVENIYSIINEVYEQNNLRVTTGQLNSILAEATARVQPPTDKGKRLKVYYMTQIGVKPPTFVCFCNDAKLFHYSYLRYLENRIRDVYGFKGTPIKMIVRQRGEQE